MLSGLVSVAAVLMLPLAAAQESCAADFTQDGLVSTNDLLYLLATFGRTVTEEGSAAALADLDGSQRVDTLDLLELLAAFGRSCADLTVLSAQRGDSLAPGASYNVPISNSAELLTLVRF